MSEGLCRFNIHYDLTPFGGGGSIFLQSLKVLYISMNVNECVSLCREQVKG